ncbi:MAG: type II secretion system F family protein [Betaproteobacteria bacterium]|nr:type II secretion system F family protein [Betaproteobacteria bacterium]
MALFSYRAIDEDGQFANGKLDAINAIDLELRLKRMGLDLVTFEQLKQGTLMRRRISRRDLITFCFHLEQLIRAGVPIIEALIDLRDTVEGGFRETVASLLEDIEGGKKLSEAMQQHPATFDQVFTSLIRAGEEAGQLPEVLAKLGENLKWQDELASQTKKAMLYPIFVGIVVGLLVFALMVFLVPQLATTLKTLSGGNLPTETKVLIAISDIFRRFWYLILGVPVAAIVTVFVLARTSREFQQKLDALSLRFPIMGPIRTKIVMARFTTFFAMMYQSGIGVLDCIQISEKIVGSPVIENGLKRIGREITEGTGITQAFQNARLFPPLVLRMLRVGESTGALDDALLNVSYFYNRDVKEAIGKLQEMIQPVLTLLLGGIFVAIITTIFNPLYDVISKVKF